MAEAPAICADGDAGSGPGVLTVTVALCVSPQQVQEVLLTLPTGSTVANALRASATGDSVEALPQLVGIWGKVCPLSELLKDGDRVEVYRPLLVDPKEARRERFARQGSRSAGLFARDRPT